MILPGPAFHEPDQKAPEMLQDQAFSACMLMKPEELRQVQSRSCIRSFPHGVTLRRSILSLVCSSSLPSSDIVS